MTDTVSVRRIGMDDARACIDALADVLDDCVTGGDAGRLYARAGWQRVGVVPNYALMPDGAFCGTTFFCKQRTPLARAI